MSGAPLRMKQRQYMAASFGPADVSPPNALGHPRRHDWIVPRRKGENGATERRLGLAGIPRKEPAQTFIEPVRVERFAPREIVRPTGLPEAFHSAARVALELTSHACNARRRNMAGEAVEPLNADQSAEPRASACRGLLQEPEHSQGMTDGDGIRRPMARVLRATPNETEIDERERSAWQTLC